jgi:hypothetical protein
MALVQKKLDALKLLFKYIAKVPLEPMEESLVVAVVVTNY